MNGAPFFYQAVPYGIIRGVKVIKEENLIHAAEGLLGGEEKNKLFRETSGSSRGYFQREKTSYGR